MFLNHGGFNEARCIGHGRCPSRLWTERGDRELPRYADRGSSHLHHHRGYVPAADCLHSASPCDCVPASRASSRASSTARSTSCDCVPASCTSAAPYYCDC